MDVTTEREAAAALPATERTHRQKGLMEGRNSPMSLDNARRAQEQSREAGRYDSVEYWQGWIDARMARQAELDAQRRGEAR